MIAKQKVNSKWIRYLIEVSIIWNGNPISCMKTFGDDHCMLCMREKIGIYKASNLDKFKKRKRLINSTGEVYGGCWHKTRFHRFIKASTPTLSHPQKYDEGCSSPERSVTHEAGMTNADADCVSTNPGSIMNLTSQYNNFDDIDDSVIIDSGDV